MTRFVLIATMNRDVGATITNAQQESLVNLLANYPRLRESTDEAIRIFSAAQVDGTNGSVRPPTGGQPVVFRKSESELTLQRFNHNPSVELNGEIRFPRALRAQFCEVFDSLSACLNFYETYGTALTALSEYVTVIQVSQKSTD
jgi:hypothetical protein